MKYKSVIFNIILCIVHQAELINQSSNHTYSVDTEIKQTFKLLDQGNKTIELSQQYMNMTLLMGVTGTGKSTFMQWLAGDNDKLISTEVNAETGEYIIVDNHRISNSTIKSMTIFPELVVDPKTDIAYYDCPGFSDTRSPSNDIATTFFIKKLIDNAQSVKLIFAIHYASVRTGGSRLDFPELIRHATNIIKDIDKYKKSISLVVTKVENHFVKVRGGYNLVPDEKIIETIAQFIRQVESDLVKSLVNATQENKQYYERSLKFVRILLHKNREHYTRIGIFRRPDEPGPLTDISLLKTGKNNINKIVNENLAFTLVSRSDFGYTISAESKNYLSDIVGIINSNITSDVESIVRKLQKYYENIFIVMRSKITTLVKDADSIKLNEKDATIYSNTIKLGFKILNNLMKEVKYITTIKLVEKIHKSIRTIGLNGVEDELKNIEKNKEYLDFFQTVNDKEYNPGSWSSFIQPIVTTLTGSGDIIQKDINEAVEKIDNKIFSNINSIVKEIMNYYKNKINSMEISKLPDEMKKDHDLIQDMMGKIHFSDSAEDLSKKIDDYIICLGIDRSKIEITTKKIHNIGLCLRFLQILSGQKLNIWSSKWISPFSIVEKYLVDSRLWYEFLNNLLIKFSRYDILKNKKKYNVANIQDWGYENKLQGISINSKNFKQFLEKIKPFGVIENNTIENIDINEIYMEDLKTVLSLTIADTITHICQSNKLVIIGYNVKVNEANEKIRECISRNSIEIYALNKIFINEDINLVGMKIKLEVIAPTWEIIDRKTINLSGSNAMSHYVHTAIDGKFHGYNGDHGIPGLPGGRSGNFFGVGADFSNGHMLTIIANGGDGSPGQNGGNGANGKLSLDPPEDAYHYGCMDMCKVEPSFRCSCGAQYSQDNGGIIFAQVLGTLIPVQFCKFDGKDGTRGGNGGHGGQGGYGGSPGLVNIISFNGNSRILTVQKAGNTGVAGKGGIGGSGGKKGNIVSVACYRVLLALMLAGKNTIHVENNRGYLPSGNVGNDGAYNKNIKLSEPTAAIGNKVQIIDEYKRRVDETCRIAGRFIEKHVFEFSTQLSKNSDIKKFYK